MLSIEALSMMLLHASITMYLLYESNHRLVALRIKVNIVASSNAVEPASTVCHRIVTNRVLNIVPEITNKSLSIVKLNSKSLIVDGTPRAVDGLTIALTLG